MMKKNRALAIQLAQRQRAEIIADTCQLEGVNFTVPEINTLLGGTTVGGHDIHDHNLAVNQINSWEKLLTDLSQNKFEFSPQYLCALHEKVAKDEALTWGRYRTGNVTIAGSNYMPPESSQVSDLVDEVFHQAKGINDTFDKAAFLFLKLSRIQPFFDGNKRTARLFANGVCLDEGHPAFSISKKQELEFNTLMLGFYDTGDMSPMRAFLDTCIDPRVVQIMNEYSPSTDDISSHPTETNHGRS